jgi:hypothetical protein
MVDSALWACMPRVRSSRAVLQASRSRVQTTGIRRSLHEVDVCSGLMSLESVTFLASYEYFDGTFYLTARYQHFMEFVT